MCMLYVLWIKKLCISKAYWEHSVIFLWSTNTSSAHTISMVSTCSLLDVFKAHFTVPFQYANEPFSSLNTLFFLYFQTEWMAKKQVKEIWMGSDCAWYNSFRTFFMVKCCAPFLLLILCFTYSLSLSLSIALIYLNDKIRL